MAQTVDEIRDEIAMKKLLARSFKNPLPQVVNTINEEIIALKRQEATLNGMLKADYKEFDPNLVWEEAKVFYGERMYIGKDFLPNLQRMVGYLPRYGHKLIYRVAYYCPSCKAWVGRDIGTDYRYRRNNYWRCRICRGDLYKLTKQGGANV